MGKVWRNNQSFIYLRFGGDGVADMLQAIALILPKTLVETFRRNVSTIVMLLHRDVMSA
ncbi:hypothetical protein [Tolypothrix sp. NIES-4075]|uniref:hypothetical protein n=1 Tax=Tolypothrix sp. NIES-4075 TaxID=2005459 RepID=UPI00135AF6CF|nr:hypothetical protein [Tolypothrix sp. NIES-4075]